MDDFNKGCNTEFEDLSIQKVIAVEDVVKKASQQLKLLNDSNIVSSSVVIDKVDEVTAQYQSLEKFKTGVDRENFVKNIQAVKDANQKLSQCLTSTSKKTI